MRFNFSTVTILAFSLVVSCGTVNTAAHLRATPVPIDWHTDSKGCFRTPDQIFLVTTKKYTSEIDLKAAAERLAKKYQGKVETILHRSKESFFVEISDDNARSLAYEREVIEISTNFACPVPAQRINNAWRDEQVPVLSAADTSVKVAFRTQKISVKGGISVCDNPNDRPASC